MVLPVIPDTSIGSEPIRERYVLDGFVINNRTNEGMGNYTVTVDKEGFRSTSTVTDDNGSYSFILPPGNFTITVCSPRGMMVGKKVILIGPHLTNYWDFQIDPENPRWSTYLGRISDDLGRSVEGALIYLVQPENNVTTTVSTDSDGRFVMNVPSGDYISMVEYNGKERNNETITLDWTEEKYVEIEIDLSDERPIFTEIFDFLVMHWMDILLLIGTTLVILVIYAIFLGISSQIKKRNRKLFDSEWFIPVRKFVGRIVILGVMMMILRQVSRMSSPIDEYIWSWAPGVGLAIMGILLILMTMSLLLNGNLQFFEYIRKKKGPRGDMLLPQQIITLIEVIARYLIIALGVVLIVILALSAFGMSAAIIKKATDFLGENAGRLLFLVALVATVILVRKFIEIFFNELGSRASKINPQVMEMSKKGLTGLIYFVIVLIFMFTLLSIAGLGEVGNTFILVISMIVGLVVSFAATGSIGNILSGLVLVSMKPYDVGDRVEVNNGLIGYVENLGIMFTRIRDLENRSIEIPNNNILGSSITNFTKSARDDGYAVIIDVTLGYDIHPKRIRSLMKRAALTSPGVLKEPTPRVLVREFRDHAVEYRLRAYVNDPQNMLFIRSSVMESMLVIFHQEGLEILSPLYHVRREGKEPTGEELDKRVLVPANDRIEDASGLTMFDTIEDDIQ